MVSKKSKKNAIEIWYSLKPFLIFLLITSILLSLALLIITLIWLYDERNITFLILVIADFSFLGIFALGLLFVGVRYVIDLLIKKEEIKCFYCGRVISSRTPVCPNCGKEN